MDSSDDLATLVATEVERREQERLLAERAAEAKAKVDGMRKREESFWGGPCRFCGVQRSAYRFARHNGFGPITEVPRWVDRNVCQECDNDRRPLGALVSDIEHRERVVRSLVDPTVSKRWWGSNIVNVSTFKWWSETQGAIGGGERRWAYFDKVDLTDKLDVTASAPPYERMQPCPTCGCTSRWLPKPPPEPIVSPSGKIVPVRSQGPTYFCAGCREFGSSVLEIKANILRRVLSVSPMHAVRELDERTGIWSESAPLVQRMARDIPLWMETGRPASEAPDWPFGYLPLLDIKMRANKMVRDETPVAGR